MVVADAELVEEIVVVTVVAVADVVVVYRCCFEGASFLLLVEDADLESFAASLRIAVAVASVVE